MLVPVVSFLFIFAVVVLVHEFGHFITAKLSGVRVFEFGVGFGPKVLKKKWHSTLYSLNLVPLGGFVKIAGLDDDPESKKAYGPGESFLDLNIFQKVLIIAAGPIMNLLTAIVVFAIIFSLFGVPRVTNEIGEVVPDSPAAKAGLKTGDRIVKVEDYKVGDITRAVSIIHNSDGKPVSVVVRRDERQLSYTLEPVYNEKVDSYLIGIHLETGENIRYNPFAALYKGGQETLRVAGLVVSGLFALVTGQVPLDQVAGPVGIARITANVAESGFVPLLGFLAFLSINLGILNLVPFPALDGGRILFLVIEGIAGKNIISAKSENYIHYIGFLILILLIILITYKDIANIIN